MEHGRFNGAALTTGAILFLTFLGVLSDYFLKLASAEKNSLLSRWFIAGMFVLCGTPFGWVYVMKHVKFASIGALYSVSFSLLVTFVGVLCFGERLSKPEIAGIVCATASLALLARFS